MTQRFAFSTSKTLLAVAIFTSMTTSHAEETCSKISQQKLQFQMHSLNPVHCKT